MKREHRRALSLGVGLVLAVAAISMAMEYWLGGSGRESQPAPPSGVIYYTGPMKSWGRDLPALPRR